jgi:hypothetical protein
MKQNLSAILNLTSYFLLLTSSPAFASGITLTPSFQEVSVIATGSSNPFIATQSQQNKTTAYVTYHNQNDYPLTLDFSLTTITATDLFGRFQFNAPLPQTINSVELDSKGTQINPQSLSLNPDETATASVTFSPDGLRPGTNAFLLLAKIAPSDVSSLGKGGRGPLGKESFAGPSELIGTSISHSLASGILVNAYGGSTIDLNLINLEWSSFPIRFSLPDYLTLTFKNDGNMRAIPRGVANSKDLFGRELNRGALNEDSTVILPGSQRVVYATLSPVKTTWPIMLVNFKIDGYDSDHQSQFTLSKNFIYLSPWFLPGAVIFILLILSLKRKFHKS